MPTQTAFARTTPRGGGLTFRAATLDDLPWAVRFQTARDPSEPANEAQMRHRWQSADPDRVDDRWIIEEGGEPVGYGYFGHPAWSRSPMRAARLLGWFPRDARRPERLGRAFDVLAATRRTGAARAGSSTSPRTARTWRR